MRALNPKRTQVRLAAGAKLLEVTGLEVRYGGIRALKGIDLHVLPGEIVALIGANGAGKTTTLKSIVRLLPLTRGDIFFEGKSIRGLGTDEVVRRGVSLVPEGRAIFPTLTVRENLELGAYVHRDPKAMRETIDDVVVLFPRIGERLGQEGGTLSGGEQQMLAIGRALMARPSLLLLDEPSLGIAPKLVTQIFEAILRIAKAGVTVLVVEQNTRVALESSQRAYVLRTGEIAMEGPSSELAKNEEIRAAYLGG